VRKLVLNVVNYFEVFGLPKILNIDLHGLEESFHELSRKFHPDYFATATNAEKATALQMTARLNDAYRTLRHPIRRVEYLLDVEGFKTDGSKVPQAFLMEMFEINEQLDELKDSSGTPAQRDALRKQIQGKSDEFTSRIEAAAKRWDELVTSNSPEAERKRQLSTMAEILSEFSYIRNLERDLEESH
jgi:molecular chaperone HscB